MALPDYQSLFLPVLRVSADGQEHSMAELREHVAVDLKLSPDDLAQKLPSGKQPAFTNRVAWAVVYLSKAQALDRVKRGVFKITKRGQELLALNLPNLTNKNLAAYPEFVAFQKGAHTQGGGNEAEKPDKTETPEEQIAGASRLLRDALATDVLEAVRKGSPGFFEGLVIDLLEKMGYGGLVDQPGEVVGGPGDAGIDGMIREDKLGLDVIYVQAKRWANSVGRPQIQAFAGSLEGAKARKGVFITTSTFTQDARTYVKHIEKRIVLIDGRELADLMIDHNVGVSISQTYELKRLDSDYFES